MKKMGIRVQILSHLLLVFQGFLALSSYATASDPLELELYSRYHEQADLVPGVALKRSLAPDELIRLYAETRNHPVTRLDQIDNYDPEGLIGFCYGRAMAAHLLARKMGLSPNGLRKLFVVGDLRSDPKVPEWRFHVATLAKGTDGTWYAIDPIMYKKGQEMPLTAREWISSVRFGWDRWQDGLENHAKFYLTSIDSVMPELRQLPDPEDASLLIHLRFNPDQRGILPSLRWFQALGFEERYDTEVIRSLNTEQENQYMMTTTEKEEDRFRFQDITINGQLIPYRHYFEKLLTSLR